MNGKNKKAADGRRKGEKMSKWDFPDERYLTKEYKEIAQEIVDLLVKHNLSNVEIDLILEYASYGKNFLRVTKKYSHSI